LDERVFGKFWNCLAHLELMLGTAPIREYYIRKIVALAAVSALGLSLSVAAPAAPEAKIVSEL
jgi:hypothetical protein